MPLKNLDISKSTLSGRTKKETVDLRKNEFSWTVSEDGKKQKSALWYSLAFLVAAVLLVVAIVQKNWLFALIIILACFIYFINQREGAKKFEIFISEEGVMVGKRLFGFSQLGGFGFLAKKEKNFVVFETQRFGEKFLTIPLIKVDQEKLGDFLNEHLPEKEYEESLTDALEDFLNF